MCDAGQEFKLEAVVSGTLSKLVLLRNNVPIVKDAFVMTRQQRTEIGRETRGDGAGERGGFRSET